MSTRTGLSDRRSDGLAQTVYDHSPAEMKFMVLQQNLQNCLSIVDNEVMKDYIPALKDCAVVRCDDGLLRELDSEEKSIQFFRITELVYQEDEFSVHKLATVFHALSNKPCTLALMIQSDGANTEFYLGVRSRGSASTGTMKRLLEQSLLGLFPGSSTEEYLGQALKHDLRKLRTGCVSSVTCIADYKQSRESLENKDFIQGLEKLVYSMQGKAFTAICIANNLEHQDLVETRKEYERIYTLMSPFANMQYNYALNQASGTTSSDTTGSARSDTHGRTEGMSRTDTRSYAQQRGTNRSNTLTRTEGESTSLSKGSSHTKSESDGVSDSETTTKTVGVHMGTSRGISSGVSVGSLSLGTSRSFSMGVSSSVSRGKTHGTSHTDTVSDSISQSLTEGLNTSNSAANTVGENSSWTDTFAQGAGAQYSENQGYTLTENTACTKALSETFGQSQAITLNVQNRALLDTLQRLDKQLKRLDECESIGMWDFAAYFLGESAAEAETAASMYRSLISGDQSGLEIAAVNSWTDGERVREISKYVTNFLHPVFSFEFDDRAMQRNTLVDATALVSTNELAIQMGLPRKSVKGLPVVEHALFAQEVISENIAAYEAEGVVLGEVNHLGRATGTTVHLDLQSLAMHTFITGSTGSGKSNTVYQMLSQLPEKGVRFLVIEPAKGEYKNVFGNRSDVAVYGTNPQLGELLRINPFSFPKEVHIYEHLDRLVEIFNVCWPMYAAMPAILKDAVERAYVNAGWDLRRSRNRYSNRLFPNFVDVLQQIDVVMEQSQYSRDNKSDYKGALSTRIRSLTNGINGLVFSSDEITAEDLFDRNVVIDLSRVGSTETKSLIMGLLVMKLQEHRIAASTDMNARLRHVTVLEEAHNLLKRTSTEQSSEGANLLGKSVEMLTNAIAEMRTYGEGFIIADQSPGLLDVSVIRNTNTKIIMRLPEYTDRELVGRAAGLSDEQINELAKLTKGVAAVYQNDWLEAVLCKVRKYTPRQTHPYRPAPDTAANTADIKGQIISRLATKDIDHLLEGIAYPDILSADMPVLAKVRLLEYARAPEAGRKEYAAAVAYELFSAQQAFAAMEGARLDCNQQKRFLLAHLQPALTPLPEPYAQAILCLIAYRHARLTDNARDRQLVKHLLEVWKKESMQL